MSESIHHNIPSCITTDILDPVTLSGTHLSSIPSLTATSVKKEEMILQRTTDIFTRASGLILAQLEMGMVTEA